jgi:hypothetical protein
MSDLYRELLIKREPQSADKLKKGGLILLTVLAAVVTVFITPLAFLLFTILCLVDYFIFPSFKVEYEYLYVNGELDVDKIISRSKRKRVASVDLANLEILAPWESHEMDAYRNNSRRKVNDFSSGKKDAFVYAFVTDADAESGILLFEPDEVMLKDMQLRAPRKVHINLKNNEINLKKM